jgi:predicted nucleic acid-binding protein
LFRSAAHTIEVAAIDDPAEREHLQLLLEEIGSPVSPDLVQVRQRAEYLAAKGLGPADAAHVAFAELSGCDFVTCDDRLLRQCRRIKPSIWCGTPVAYCEKEELR